MQNFIRSGAAAVLVALCASNVALAGATPPGTGVEGLLELAKANNPEYASMLHEADAAQERVAPAGALADPRLRIELMDITRMGEQSPTLLPGDVGSTRYTLMQELPWFGKRDLRRDMAAQEAEGAKARVRLSWVELSQRIKARYAQYYYLHQSERLTAEILDLMGRLEQVALVRYASGLAAQQDVIRAQVEQSNLRNELVALENEQTMVRARLNAMLARPANAALSPPQDLRALPTAQRVTYDALQERVRNNNPQVFADDAKLRSAQRARELTYKNRYPDFALSLTPVQYGSAIKEWSLMVELNIPLQQSTRRAQEREAEAMVAAAQARKEATANQMLGELAESLSGLDAARRTEVITATSLLPQAELTFKTALASYETGKVDFGTLLDAQRQIRQAKQSRFKAQSEAQTRLAEIEKILGEDL